jgi:cob(I)alamin adenosyltransferase
MKTINKVYTRTGDKGMTSLVGGVRIKKTDVRLEAYGTVDELSAHLGLLASMLPPGEDRDVIIRIQNNLFNVCTHLATDQRTTPLYPSAYLAEGETSYLEQLIDDTMMLLPERQGFVLPGGCQTAAQCHVARTVCRRAERRIAALAEVAEVGQDIQQYVNRLSDYLFVLSKKINFNNGVSEIIWKNACR